MRQEIQDLFDKASKLKANEVLYTTFGADRHYIIRKKGKGYLLQAFRNKWLFQKEGKLLTESSFKTAEQLNTHIFTQTWIEHYATNHFTQKVVHLDNWVNFVNAFKLSKLYSKKGKSVTQDVYYYVPK